MFCDEVKVHLIAGKGGGGAIAFRREKYVAKGGPSGGDGGRGGSVYLQADENINTLAEFNTHKIFRAKTAEPGQGGNKAGADSLDLILPVPVGTVVFDEKKKKILGDLQAHGELLEIARGGRGGYGNAHFKSSTRQAPTFAELGEPGQERICVLELKLVADVGIIGLPSVGKSTLIARISNARPRIADYHFTTLIPNLGLVSMRDFGGSPQESFVACDLPGLIEGAHKGRGLGIRFLKHVMRNRVLVHLVDVTSPSFDEDYTVIRNELKKFDRTLIKKPTIVAFNKIDAVSEEDVSIAIQLLRKKHRAIKKIYPISCVSGKGLQKLMFTIWEELKQQRAEEHRDKPQKIKNYKIFRPGAEEDPKHFTINVTYAGKKKRTFEIHGRRIEQIVVMTDFTNSEAVARVYDVIEKLSINKELRRYGAKFGDDIIIGKQKITYRW